MTNMNHHESCGRCHQSPCTCAAVGDAFVFPGGPDMASVDQVAESPRISWNDTDGDLVWLRVMYAEESGSGYREATPADLAAAGYVPASRLAEANAKLVDIERQLVGARNAYGSAEMELDSVKLQRDQATAKLEAAERELADVRTLDDWAERMGWGRTPAPALGNETPGRRFVIDMNPHGADGRCWGDARDAARASAAAWVREQKPSTRLGEEQATAAAAVVEQPAAERPAGLGPMEAFERRLCAALRDVGTNYPFAVLLRLADELERKR